MERYMILINDIELTRITTDLDTYELPEMGKHTIKVNDIDLSRSNSTDDDSVFMSQILMDTGRRKSLYQNASSRQKVSMILCFVSYFFLLLFFVTVYVYILVNIISTDDKEHNENKHSMETDRYNVSGPNVIKI